MSVFGFEYSTLKYSELGTDCINENKTGNMRRGGHHGWTDLLSQL